MRSATLGPLGACLVWGLGACGPEPFVEDDTAGETTDASSKYYGDPANGCLPDEDPIAIQDVDGSFCAPSCIPNGPDCPDATRGTALCTIDDNSGGRYCAVGCDPGSESTQCPAGSSCVEAYGAGLCTYP